MTPSKIEPVLVNTYRPIIVSDALSSGNMLSMWFETLIKTGTKSVHASN